jgi:hypothetical protein
MLVTSLPSFHVDELPGFYTDSLPGLHFLPSLWTDNDPNIILTYNEKKHLTAYIEDYYQPTIPEGSNATENIQWKYNATTSHIVKATTHHPDSLFWTWASSEDTDNSPPEWPRIMALGNGSVCRVRLKKWQSFPCVPWDTYLPIYQKRLCYLSGGIIGLIVRVFIGVRNDFKHAHRLYRHAWEAGGITLGCNHNATMHNVTKIVSPRYRSFDKPHHHHVR